VSPSHTWFSFIFHVWGEENGSLRFQLLSSQEKPIHSAPLRAYVMTQKNFKRTILTIYDSIFVHLPPLLMFKIPRSWFIESHKAGICEDYKHLVPYNAGSGKSWPFSPSLGTYVLKIKGPHHVSVHVLKNMSSVEALHWSYINWTHSSNHIIIADHT
jgi:hypothetical protein